MNINDAKTVVDYYLARQATWTGWVIPAAAAFIALISLSFTIWWARRSQHEQTSRDILKLWDEVISDFSKHPNLLNTTVTRYYPSFENSQDRFIYDSLCYKAWGLFRQIVEKRLDAQNSQFLAVCQWIVAHHFRWLESNPLFFPGPVFWERVDKFRREPVGILHLMPLPRSSSENETGGYSTSINWDLVAADYHRFILSPFAPEMLRETATGKGRNELVNVLNSMSAEDFAQLDVLDIGCGPGNLLVALKHKPKSITGVDFSKDALRIAQKRGAEKGLAFIPVEKDFRDLHLGTTFDIVVSVNSVLPSSRSEVVQVLRSLRSALKPSGSLYAILPSFDTTVYLRTLWFEHYKKLFGDVSHAERCVAQIDTYKRVDSKERLYADDGVHQQAYHDEETIREEFEKVGLTITHGPQKIYYPWELTKHFDYGYFPGAKEEIWDWYVVARRGSPKG